ncbi:MAG: DEAD/DEAH box helicase [Candidatus Lokiarchaeota archaeon]|nr:DEAD/DEAH box helicase [Candidatus Lokiarchaeota archaeon]
MSKINLVIVKTKYNDRIYRKLAIIMPEGYFDPDFIKTIKSVNIKVNGRVWNPKLKAWLINFTVQAIESTIAAFLDSSMMDQSIIRSLIKELKKAKKQIIQTATIKIKNQCILYPFTRVAAQIPNFYQKIRELIGFKHPAERQIRQYSRKDLSIWDGRIVEVDYSYKKNNMIFDIGYLDKIINFLKQNNIKVNIIDKRGEFLGLSESPDINSFNDLDKVEHQFNINFYPEQKDAIEIILNTLYADGHCLYQFPTGLGKTEIAMSIIQILNIRTIILVNRKDLLYQWKNRMETKLKIKAGIIGDGKFDLQPITVATVQSLWSYIKSHLDISSKNLEQLHKFINTGKIEVDSAPITNTKLFEYFSLVILDEVHIGAADTFLHVLRRFTAKYYLGQSATTWRTDGFHPLLWGIFGKPVYKYRLKNAVDKGYLVEPIVQLVDTGFRVPKNIQRYNSGKKELKYNPDRNELITEIVKDAEKPAIIFTGEITHQKEISRYLKNANIDHITANGNTSSEQRQQILEQIRNNEIDIAILTPIWDEGVDVPCLSSVLLVFPGRSDVKLIQRIGRGIRKSKGKSKCFIYDFVIVPTSVGVYQHKLP